MMDGQAAIDLGSLVERVLVKSILLRSVLIVFVVGLTLRATIDGSIYDARINDG